MTHEELIARNAHLEEVHTKALGYENLRRACGYVQDGSSQSVRITMSDDASKVLVKAGSRSVSGATLAEALDNAAGDPSRLPSTMIEERAQYFDNLVEVFGLATERGETLAIGEDDATFEFTVHIGRDWAYGKGLSTALEAAIQEFRPNTAKPG